MYISRLCPCTSNFVQIRWILSGDVEFCPGTLNFVQVHHLPRFWRTWTKWTLTSYITGKKNTGTKCSFFGGIANLNSKCSNAFHYHGRFCTFLDSRSMYLVFKKNQNEKYFFSVEKFLSKKKFRKKIRHFLKKSKFQLKSHLKSIFQKSILNDFSIGKNLKTCFCKKKLIFSQNIFSRDFFSFRKKTCFEKKIPISIRNFLKIPKIALRKSCDKFKAVKNKKSEFFYKFYAILVMC